MYLLLGSPRRRIWHGEFWPSVHVAMHGTRHNPLLLFGGAVRLHGPPQDPMDVAAESVILYVDMAGQSNATPSARPPNGGSNQ